MVPITIGLGLINFNAVVDTFFAARLIDKYHAPSAINAPSASTCSRRGCSRSRSRPCSSRRSRGSPRARTWTASAARSRAGSARSRSCSSRRASSAPSSRSRSSGVVYQRGDFTAAQTPSYRRRARRVLARARVQRLMLMLNRAFFSLQSPWIPTWVALGNLGLNAALDAAFYRSASGACRSRPRSSTSPAPSRCSMLLRRRLGAHRPDGDRAIRRARHDRERRARRRLLRRLGRPRTPRSAGRSSPRSSRCSRRSPPGSVTYLVVCRLLGVRELDTLLSLRRHRAV